MLNQRQKNVSVDDLITFDLARAVSKLRKHSNDQIAGKAKELRRKWKSLAKTENENEKVPTSNESTAEQVVNTSSSEPPPAAAEEEESKDPAQHLEYLRGVLEKDSTTIATKLAAISELSQMELSLALVVSSKIGHIVSTLRKSRYVSIPIDTIDAAESYTTAVILISQPLRKNYVLNGNENSPIKIRIIF